MTDPGLDELAVDLTSLLDAHSLLRFVALELLLLLVKELLCALRCSDHVDNSLVAPVSELDRGPASFIEDSLPALVCSVSRAIHDATVEQDYHMRILHLGHVDEDLL